MALLVHDNDYDRFDSKMFFETFYKDFHRPEWAEGLLKFLLDTLSDLYSSGKIQGDRLLDFGTGPTIHNLISAACHFPNIYLSDFSEGNRNALWRWLTKDTDSADFSHMFQYLNTKEGCKKTWQIREDEMRQTIRGILKCDMTNANPLFPSMFPQFDVISTSLCLETVPTSSLSGYETAVRNVASLCKPGGWVILIGELHGHFYCFGNSKYDVVTLSKEDVERVWRNEGFEIHNWKQYAKPDISDRKLSETDDPTPMFCMAARKER